MSKKSMITLMCEGPQTVANEVRGGRNTRTKFQAQSADQVIHVTLLICNVTVKSFNN